MYNIGDEDIFGDTSNILGGAKGLRKKLPNGKTPKMIEITWVSATQAGEELGTAANNVLDGTTTPVLLHVLSAQANDTDAATGDVRKIAIIGVTVASVAEYTTDPTKAKLTVEVVNMNGATGVATTRYYVRVIGAYAIQWGSGGADAKGNITVTNVAEAVVYVTITATYNESNGGVVYLPKDLHAQINVDMSFSDATVAASDGVLLTATEYGYDGSGNIDPEFTTEASVYLIAPTSNVRKENLWFSRKKADTINKLTFTETLVANSQTVEIITQTIITA